MAGTPSKARETASAGRYRLSVPESDSSVREWLEAQENPSISLRLVIKDLIEREGIVDVLNRPVTQQPRRGRPPVSDTGSAAEVAAPRGATQEGTTEGAPSGLATEPQAATQPHVPAPATPAPPTPSGIGGFDDGGDPHDEIADLMASTRT